MSEEMGVMEWRGGGPASAMLAGGIAVLAVGWKGGEKDLVENLWKKFKGNGNGRLAQQLRMGRMSEGASKGVKSGILGRIGWQFRMFADRAFSDCQAVVMVYNRSAGFPGPEVSMVQSPKLEMSGSVLEGVVIGRGRRAGFTLVEALVVISLITLLISMLMPSLAKSKKMARDAIDLSSQRQIMNAVLAYSVDALDRLPMSGRTWPHMGMLDLYEGCLRGYISGDLKLLQCPLDDPNMGSIANWWRGWYGTPMVAGDHKYLKPGEPAEVPYSYYWFVKMYWAVGPNGILIGSNAQAQFRVADIRHPSRLIVHRCFINHGNEPGVFTGMQSAFIDAHAEWVDVNRIRHAAVPAYGFYNLDWTKDGIRGQDLK